MLGETFAGIITSDDHSVYNSYHKNGLRQLCWAHIIRKLKALKEDRSSPHAYCFAKHVLEDIEAILSPSLSTMMSNLQTIAQGENVPSGLLYNGVKSVSDHNLKLANNLPDICCLSSEHARSTAPTPSNF